MQLAPIVLFVYNRPEHTRKTIEALQRDTLAGQSELIIYSDGHKGYRDRCRVEEVREFLRGITGFRKVLLRESQSNRGLAASIIEGVTSVISEYGRIIVLEDDLVVSPKFLTYMNDALEKYADVEQVMHVSGYWYPVDWVMKPETFFLGVPSSWGWATWARAWQWFEKNPKSLQKFFSPHDIILFNLDGANDFWEQVVHNINGKADTWAIFWYAAIFRRNGMCLYPSSSLVRNTGADGTGVHCVVTSIYESQLADKRVKAFPSIIQEDTTALEKLKKFYLENKMGRWKRFFEVTKVRLMKRLSANK